MAQDLLKKLKPLLDNSLGLTQMTPAKAEAFVREMVKQGEVRRKEAEAMVQGLVDQGRDAAEKLMELVRVEVAKQMTRMGAQIESLEAQVQELTGLGRKGSASTPAPTPAVKKTPAKKAPAAKKAAPAKKAPAAKKAAPAKKAPAAKKAAPAKKAAAKKSAS